MTEAFPLRPITNGVTTLTFQQDAVHGLRYVTIDVGTPDAADDPPASVPLAATSPWKVTLRDVSVTSPGGSDGLCHISTSDLPNPLPDTVTLSGPPSMPNAFEAIWNVTDWTKPGAPSFPNDDFQVILRGKTAGSDDFCTFELEAKVTESTPRTSIYRTELRASVDTQGTKPTQTLAAPWYVGALFPEPMENPVIELLGLAADVRLSHPDLGSSVPTHPGVMSMQWMAYYDAEDPNLFFWGTRDVEHHVKPYIVYQEKANQGLCFGAQYYPPDSLTTTGPVIIPFPVIISARKGDWYDAAQFYRSWALGQSWVPEETAPTDPDFSDLVRNADALGTVAPMTCEATTTVDEDTEGVPKDHSQFGNWIGEWDEFRSFFLVQTILGRVWFWDHNSFRAAIGDWFPMKGAFKDGAPRDAEGYTWAPYVHPSSYNVAVPGYDSKLKVVDEFGSLTESKKLTVPQTGGCSVVPKQEWTSHALCHGTSTTIDYVRDVLTRFLEEFHDGSPPAGAPDPAGLYLDEFHIKERICFDASHSHPTGGGNYFVAGKLGLLAGIKQDLRDRNPDAFLWIEGVSEPYLRHVDVCNLRYGGVGVTNVDDAGVVRAPLFQTVYNEYLRFASNTAVDTTASTPSLKDPVAMLFFREVFARQVFEAGELSLSTILSPMTLEANMDANPLVEKTLLMLKQYVLVLQQQDAKDLVRFGQRLRAPSSDVRSLRLPGPGPEVTEQLSGLDASVLRGPNVTAPIVYTAAFGDLGARVALLFINWTAKEDESILPEPGAQSLPVAKRTGPPPSAGLPDLGPQELTVTLDLGQWGFAEGNYKLLHVETGGTTSQDLDYTLGEPIEQTISVSERSIELYVIEPAISPLSKPEPERHHRARPSGDAKATSRPVRRRT